MPFAQVRDLQMYYERRGSGPRLLYISGTGGDLRRKPNIFDRPLAQHFEILTYDQRGLGQTTQPDSDYTMADYAEDANALLDVVGWDRCHVMGQSFGGMVGPELALRYPQRIDRLVLACTSSGGAGGASFPLHDYLSDTPLERATRQLTHADMRHDAAWQAAHPEEFQKLREPVLAGFYQGDPSGEMTPGQRRQILARAQHDVYDRLPALKMPVFICGGRYDGIAPIANQEALLRQMPHARMELFEGGHGFLAEDPRAFERVIAFLGGELDDEPVKAHVNAA